MKSAKRFIPLLVLTNCFQIIAQARAELMAGAAVVDVSPVKFPVLVNGNMTSVRSSKVLTRLNARAIVVSDQDEMVAMVVVDSCMMSREVLDDAKVMAAKLTGVKPDRMMISATHTHTAAASMGCLGTDPDPDYAPYLKVRLVQAIAEAQKNLEPAQVGFAKQNAAAFTAVRRWVIRPDRMGNDPFGNTTVRANMHAGGNWDNAVGESGPEDPDLSLIAFQAMDGRPIAILANFSMHYFSGVEPIHADYFGLFSEGLQKTILQEDSSKPPLVAMMSHGCSGDIWRRDYTVPANQQPNWKIDEYANGLIDIAKSAYEKIVFQKNADLAMAEQRLRLNYRVPDAQRLQWAQQIVEKLGDREPKSSEEIYAREQVFLDQKKTTEIVLQAIRIGDIAIATTPTETYALTGLKLKLQSPLEKTVVIELANGGDGYIPPPEQHLLGGYNTWAARSAGLEVTAEPKIVAQSLALLEKITQRPRRVYQQSRGPLAKAILDQKPLAYWRLDEFSPSLARDISGNNRHAAYEEAVLPFLEGPESKGFCELGETNRSAHFAGGRLVSEFQDLKGDYTVSLWFWNGLPLDARSTTGWLFSRDQAEGLGLHGDHVGLGGIGNHPNRLIYQNGPDGESATVSSGKTDLQRWQWNHLKFVRSGERVMIFLNGQSEPEISVVSSARDVPPGDHFYFGGRSDHQATWEGRLDEIAVFEGARMNK